MKNNLIFVSIASYKDPELVNTLEDLYSNADNPDLIRTVVFNQTDFESNQDHTMYLNDRQIEIVSINFKNTKGVSWARHKIQSFIENEKYYLQIDAHMRFAKSWDTKLIHYLQLANSTKPVITFYPSGFDTERGKYESNIIINEPRGMNRKAVPSRGIGLGKQPCNLEHGDDKPILGSTYAAGFVFASIDFPKEVPYDPSIFWNYEESDQTFRAFTNGWMFFGTPECLIWHKYNTTGSANHFKESRDLVGFENRSNAHAEHKYFSGKYNGKYGLGSKRSLKEFEILHRVDFEKGTLADKDSKDVIIVVPYRDRERDLKVYLEKVPEYFNSQNLTYDILITELDPEGSWNAGLVCNTVYNFVKKTNYKYIYIHHVDVYPIEGEWKFPNHNEVFMGLGDVGSCMTTLENFYKVGGYRNTFWGWGAEDDDLYNKFRRAGITVLDINQNIERFPVKYNVEFQNHDRPFKGKLYGGNVEQLTKVPDRNYNSIFDVNKYSTTHSLEKLQDNIYRQRVKPLVKSPLETEVKNLVVGVITDLNFSDIVPFVKTATIYGAGKFDTVILDASKEENAHLAKEVAAFGCIYKKVAPLTTDLFTERYQICKDYIETTEYENVIMSDISDVYFQGNPFEHYNDIPEGHLVFASEGITIEDSEWNKSVLNYIYNQEVIDSIAPYEVLCCGVIGGKKADILDLIDKYLAERKSLNRESTPVRGEDQPIIQKMLYADQSIKRFAYRSDTPYCAHLHAPIYQPNECRFTNDIQIDSRSVRNPNNDLFTIVHQYNRHPGLYKTVVNHFKEFFIALVNN